MLKSQAILNDYHSLKNELAEGITAGVDVNAKADELKTLFDSYKLALEEEKNKKINSVKENTKPMDMKQQKKVFNRVLKNCLLGQTVAEADRELVPQIVNAANGQYFDTTSDTTKGKGAFLVPEEYLNLYPINEGMVDLSRLVYDVQVSAPTGKIPTVDMSQRITLADFTNDNDTEISKTAAVFGQTPYTLGTRGTIINVAREILQDANADVIAIINSLFQRAAINTVNADILTAAQETGVGTFTATANPFDDIKQVLIAELPVGSVNNPNVKIVVNQTTFAALMNIKNDDGDYMLVPMVADPERYQVMGHEVVVVEDQDLDDDTYIIGDFKQLMKINRVGLEIATSEEAGFKTNSVACRCLVRYVVKNMNHDAFVVIS